MNATVTHAKRTPIIPVLHRVCIMVTDLWADEGGWSANAAWVRHYYATAANARTAERLAIGKANAAHGRFRPHGWADNSGSWKIPGACIGACLEMSHDASDYAFPCAVCGQAFTMDDGKARHCDDDNVDGFAPDHMADHEPVADPVHFAAIAAVCGERIAGLATGAGKA